ncbi:MULTISPECIES: flagellar biosynthetic protein FliQ [Pseudoxanthomonas]|jgi:Flagellar biosynthesis pathway, component FliQ|uniref:Flagellar biosynthetic protein FliQ n=1 Tax=Pseudoxanthomonas taiwanensis J19 TaxID=935569 RepID=A0A562CYI2_9GAMM|nr:MULTISPECIES: flagellar biosynthetic protein FliQ [Pseudoxanthomonas]RRN78617.1 flagellar type III secretion system protein FliQ [Pseudoxanthomonas sp. SGD-10]TWH02556.1 flagellar biosynthetic protein FliQ [Pseudoxanthomonas taiwanensis J19]
MSPELALTELRRALEVALWVGGPLLVTMLVVGVVVGIVQAATQINEPTIAFISKAVAMTAALFALGSFLLAYLVDYTTTLFQRIPHLIG